MPCIHLPFNFGVPEFDVALGAQARQFALALSDLATKHPLHERHEQGKANLLERVQLASANSNTQPTDQSHPPAQQEPLDLEHEDLFSNRLPRFHRTNEIVGEPARAARTAVNCNLVPSLMT